MYTRGAKERSKIEGTGPPLAAHNVQKQGSASDTELEWQEMMLLDVHPAVATRNAGATGRIPAQSSLELRHMILRKTGGRRAEELGRAVPSAAERGSQLRPARWSEAGACRFEEVCGGGRRRKGPEARGETDHARIRCSPLSAPMVCRVQRRRVRQCVRGVETATPHYEAGCTTRRCQRASLVVGQHGELVEL